MQDRPNVRELLEAIERFLERDAVPALEGPKQFHARVAANVLRIVVRELELAPALLKEEWRRLVDLLGEVPDPAGDGALEEAVRARTDELCRRIRAGEADAEPFRHRVLAHVRKTVEEKLRIANPRMLKSSSGK